MSAKGIFTLLDTSSTKKQGKMSTSEQTKHTKKSTKAETATDTTVVATPPTKDVVETKTTKVPKPSKKSKKVKVENEASADEKAPKFKRTLKKHITNLESSGIGIGPTKVKKILMNNVLNNREYEVKKELVSRNKTFLEQKGDSTKSHMKLSPEATHMVQEAEKHYEQQLMDDYESEYLSLLKTSNPTKYNSYLDLKKKALSDNKENTFDLHKFNVSFDSKFYAGYETYKSKNDKYKVGSVKISNNKTSVEYNQYTRAIALINKTCYRLSGGTRNRIASFLDYLVIQYVDNAFYNCLNTQKKQVTVECALKRSDKFQSRVSLYKFAETLTILEQTTKWLTDYASVKEHNQKMKSTPDFVEVAYPEFPHLNNVEHDFNGYVDGLCKSVKNKWVDMQTTDETKERAMRLTISGDLKQFCSYMIYESILRIGVCLKTLVRKFKIRTINDSTVSNLIENIHCTCGVDYEPTNVYISQSLTKFKAWRLERYQNRKNKRDNKAQTTATTTA